ncbi:MAG: hypothetical protein GWM87_06810 [Xanthomonadales bacterium]|nr:hypothetical protein [Xanthomonadales bacterium]NIX12675.1 hypothetical protein [Xanthomonadales bacterium]
METFAEVRDHIIRHHPLNLDEPFLLGFEIPMEASDRRQSMFLAELKSADGRRFLRVETPVVPLAEFDAEKCLRINLLQRVGYLAVGDLDGVAYIKVCENMPYASLNGEELEYVINTIAPFADRIERALDPGDDVA